MKVRLKNLSALSLIYALLAGLAADPGLARGLTTTAKLTPPPVAVPERGASPAAGADHAVPAEPAAMHVAARHVRRAPKRKLSPKAGRLNHSLAKGGCLCGRAGYQEAGGVASPTA